MHSTEDINDGYLGSGKRIKAEVKKYGKENFVKEILEYLPSREALCEREAEIVNEDVLKDPLCLNLKNGGEGGWEHVNKSRTPEDLVKLGRSWRGNSTGNKGVPRTPEWRQNLSRAIKGKPGTLGMLGKQHSQNSKVKMSESGSGEKNSQFGTCWVTNGVKPVKIKKEQLDEYLTKGFRRGRK